MSAHPSKRPEIARRRAAELERAESSAAVAQLQRAWQLEDEVILETEQNAARAARSQPVTQERQYPKLDVLLSSIGTALGKSRAESEQKLRGEIAALEARIGLLERQVAAERDMRLLADDVTKRLDGRDATLQRMQTLLEAMADHATPHAKVAAARLRQ